MTAALLLAALVAGYGLGRWRPWMRFGDWANWEMRFHLDRYTTRPRQALLFAALLATDTRETVRAWRHRHDPPPPREPAPTIRDLTNRQEPTR
ncbi:hypothetical protein ACWIG4_18150 [Streptomyces sp. NPDC002248]